MDANANVSIVYAIAFCHHDSQSGIEHKDDGTEEEENVKKKQEEQEEEREYEELRTVDTLRESSLKKKRLRE